MHSKHHLTVSKTF